jgi:hypothetical protein
MVKSSEIEPGWVNEAPKPVQLTRPGNGGLISMKISVDIHENIR